MPQMINQVLINQKNFSLLRTTTSLLRMKTTKTGFQPSNSSNCKELNRTHKTVVFLSLMLLTLLNQAIEINLILLYPLKSLSLQNSSFNRICQMSPLTMNLYFLTRIIPLILHLSPLKRSKFTQIEVSGLKAENLKRAIRITIILYLVRTEFLRHCPSMSSRKVSSTIHLLSAIHSLNMMMKLTKNTTENRTVWNERSQNSVQSRAKVQTTQAEIMVKTPTTSQVFPSTPKTKRCSMTKRAKATSPSETQRNPTSLTLTRRSQQWSTSLTRTSLASWTSMNPPAKWSSVTAPKAPPSETRTRQTNKGVSF